MNLDLQEKIFKYTLHNISKMESRINYMIIYKTILIVRISVF